MLSILSFLTGIGPAISSVWTSINDLQKAKILAQTDVEKAQIQAQIVELQSKAQVLVAESGSRINAFMRFLIALGPTAYFTKIFLWDKVVGAFMGCAKGGGMSLRPTCDLFNTDALIDPNLWWVALAVVGFYFVTTKNWKS